MYCIIFVNIVLVDTCNSFHQIFSWVKTKICVLIVTGSDCCLTSEEESLLRPMMKANAMMPNQSLQGKLEVDGLATLHSDIQTRLQHIFLDFKVSYPIFITQIPSYHYYYYKIVM
jgi:hypothetical protein